MRLRNIKISRQLFLGFSILISCVILINTATYQINNRLFEQTKMIYNHPLKTRRILMALESNILRIQVWTRDLLLVKTERERELAAQKIKIAEDDFQNQLDLLKELYLGSSTDIDNVRKASIGFQTSVDVLTKNILLGKVGEVSNNILNTGNLGETRKQLMTCMGVVDNFSREKSDEIFLASIKAYSELKKQQLFLIITIILITLLIYFVIVRNITRPLNEMTNIAVKFYQGDFEVRSKYESNNELGILSKTFNNLAISIQKQRVLETKVTGLMASLLSEYGVEDFFQTMLVGLQEHTDSQMVAIYLQNDDKKSYDHYKSIGLDKNAKKKFSVIELDGEIGSVISSKKIQLIRNSPTDSHFIFSAISGSLNAQEIISIPIIASGEVIAVISLATISRYHDETLAFIKTIYIPLCARIEGVLAYRRLKDFSEKMEIQNRELESQKIKLAAQSSELSEQNYELEIQKTQLSEASKLKSNFLSNMSHELRTPLNSVIALSGVLSRKLSNKISSEEIDYLEVIERNGKHLLDMINDILDISRIEAGKTDLNISWFSVTEAVQDVLTLVQPQANQKGLLLQLDHSGNENNIASDLIKFKHIVQNFLGNAIKFTDTGKITLSIKNNNNQVIISVKDTGIGISPNHLQHIFEEFRQADSGTTRRYGGSGLGLAIARKYTEVLGGSISVTSEIGIGSEFVLILPMQHNYHESPMISEVVSETVRKNTESQNILHKEHKCKVLLVDDSEPAIIQMNYFLKEQGYDILIARDGNEALEIIAQTIPDAMILDLMMPRIDGFKVLATIREESKTAHIPVLILTARPISKEELQFLKRNNVHQLIQKGKVGREELLNAISSMVDISKNQNSVSRNYISILIVEDNADNMLTAKAILQDKYKILEAKDGSEAIKQARLHLPDLILMDIGLPGIDGIEAFHIIRNDPRLMHIPIIAVTASALVSDKESILALGFNAYFPKPIEEQKFCTMIEEILEQNKG